ncbi:RNA recognition motif-containing protein [Coemansia biformis]|uniref:RNA recognition motif-containing protein n=1 Tax=Coemansia biformis TaxID=1286918 RepID=A0A9W8CZJ9_9FUNG|nr:RNA recognition motif-containing protein [Coemansia biformis]
MSELDALFDKLDQGGAPDQAPAEPAATADKPKAKAKAQPAEKYSKSMIFVRGIPRDATNDELEGFFSSVGPVRSCFVVGVKASQPSDDAAAAPDADAGAGAEEAAGDKQLGNRGFGFVQYVLAEDAARAMEELAETKFRNQRRLLLDFAMRKHAQAGGDAEGDRPVKRPRPDAPQKQPTEPRTKAPRTSKDGSSSSSSSKGKGQDVESRTVTISGIPAGATKKHLVKRTKKIGDPHSVVYPVPFPDATEEQLKDGAGGTAHVTFGNHATAVKAVKSLHDHTFKGAKLTAQLKTERVDKSARLILRNLPFKVRERDLEKLMSECGTVLEVDLPRKFEGGPLRGFAFVQMGDYVSATRAVAKWNNTELHGRTITAAFAIAKDKFKAMEESGEIEKPVFGGAADSDVEMKEAGDDDANEGEDSAAESGDENAMDEDKDEDDEEDKDEDAEDVASNADGSDSDDEGDTVDESVKEGCTLFIRNLCFESDEDGLFDLFRKFGRLRYCRVVNDHVTGRSRGTAFVCFWNSADAAKCLEAADAAEKLLNKVGSTPSAARPDQRNKSVLLRDAPTALDSTSQFLLDGRNLLVAQAVDRKSAHTLAVEGQQQRKSKDKRNTYLLKEGVVFPDTPSAALMAPADLEHHIKEYGVRKNQILKNPNLYMSTTRLTIHNIPRTVDDTALRNAAITAIAKFKQEVRAKTRQPLSKDEMEEGWDKVPRLKQAKVIRAADRVDAATGKARSMGYAFIEFTTHAHALACLRYLNFSNSKQAFSKLPVDDDEPMDAQKSAYKISRRSLRVMFAIENAQIVKTRELRHTLAHKRLSSKNAGGDADSAAGEQRHGKPRVAKGRVGKKKSETGAPWWDGKGGKGGKDSKAGKAGKAGKSFKGKPAKK